MVIIYYFILLQLSSEFILHRQLYLEIHLSFCLPTLEQIEEKINDHVFICIGPGLDDDENIIYCLYYDKFPITDVTNPGLVYLSSVMVFSDGFSDTQNKLDPNWSINYLLLQNIVTATQIHTEKN